MKIKIIGITGQQFAKRAFFLLWQACGGPQGMGFFKDRPSATEDDVFNNVANCGDYPGGNQFGRNEVNEAAGRGDLYGDYVFGRMMKFGMSWHGDVVNIEDGPYQRDYQDWSGKYPTAKSIADATIESFGPEVVDYVEAQQAA